MRKIYSNVLMVINTTRPTMKDIIDKCVINSGIVTNTIQN